MRWDASAVCGVAMFSVATKLAPGDEVRIQEVGTEYSAVGPYSVLERYERLFPRACAGEFPRDVLQMERRHLVWLWGRGKMKGASCRSESAVGR